MRGTITVHVIDECVLHLAGSQSLRGSGWGVVLRAPGGELLARSSGGEPGATSYRMELVALLRGLASVPSGTPRICIRMANHTLASICSSFIRSGVLPRKARYPDLMRELRPLLTPFDARWVDTGRNDRDARDKEAKTLAQASAIRRQVARPDAVGGDDAPPSSTAEDEDPPMQAESARARVIAFTDGGCRGNPGLGGWGFLVVDTRTHAALERRGGERHTTNNRMEMTAAIRALEAVKREGELVEVRSDSQYLVNMCSRWIGAWKARGWRRKGKAEILNLDLVQRLDALMARHDVRWTWVRGHAGNRGNEHVDRLANQAMDLMACAGASDAEKRYGPGQSPIRVADAAPARAAASE